ncbi:MAG: tetratricopeptide repeat protein, partial [Nitrososphaera sp.]|nr:tetratricopeptide repeat protein [Nitrososphaera sp.]
ASILDRQIDELSREIARGVGLSKRQIEAAQIPIAEVTTTSMEAYNYFMRGREEWEKLYFDDAKKFLKKAVEIDSTFAMAYLYLTLAYVGLDRTKVKETLEKAKAFAEHATDKEKLYINYFYEKAIEYFKRYAAVSPGDANPFDSMADIYLVMGKLDEALAKYKEAVEVKPEFIHSYMKIAYIHALRENYAEVMKPLDQFIAMAPSPLLEGQGHVQKAFFHHYWLGQLEPCLQEIHTAKNLFDRVGAAADKALLNWVSAWIYYDRGEFEVSRRHFENGFKISMEHPSHTEYGSSYDRAAYSFGLGFVDLKQGKIDSARSRLEDMKSLLPEIDAAGSPHIRIYYDLLHGELLLAQGDLADAIAVFEKMAPWKLSDQLDRVRCNTPFLQDGLGRAYQQQGDFDKAIVAYERLITFDPAGQKRLLTHPKYHYKLAKLYEEKDWSVKAIAQYEKFLEIWKDADKDLPELIDAKKRLAKLQGR